MPSSQLRIQLLRTATAGLAVAFFAGPGCAANLLSANPSSVTLSCSTTTGPGAAASITIKPAAPLTGSATLAVSLGTLPAGVVATAPSTTTLSTANQSAGLTYSVSIATGCAGSNTGKSSFSFSTASGPDVSVTVNTTVTATSTALVTTPASLTVTCIQSAGPPVTYNPGPPQPLTVTSAATGGTPFTIDATKYPPPKWLSVPSGTSTATSTGVALSFTAAGNCGSYAGAANTGAVHLVNSPAPDKVIPVTLLFGPNVLAATPGVPAITYAKGAGTPSFVDVNITAPGITPAPMFSVDTTSLPIWLNVDSLSGQTPKKIRFSTTSIADSLNPGTYSANVLVSVPGFVPLTVPVSLLITNPPPTLSTVEGTTRNLTWTIGTPLPTSLITLVSSDTPISYSITSAGPLHPAPINANQQKGLAYNFGTAIPIAFDPTAFLAPVVNATLTGALSVTGPSSTILITFNVLVQPAPPAMTAIIPSILPTAAAGQVFTVAITGNGFIPGSDPTLRTNVGIVAGSKIVNDTNIAVNILNQSNILLTITVPATADTNLPFTPTGKGGNVVLGVCNPSVGSCTIPTAQATLSITPNPIISAVTSASTFEQVTSTVQTVAPYDMLSIFGSSFCSSGGTGCTGNQVLSATADAVTRMYPISLSPDAAGANQRSLSVAFWSHGTSPTLIAAAPLLFATNNQINLVVPGAVAAQAGSPVDIIVSFGSKSAMKSSAAYTVNIVATDPGIFTLGSDGIGDGAILDSHWSVIGQANPAGMSLSGTSDTIEVFMTGLGAPANPAGGGNSVPAGWPASCESTTGYLASLAAATNVLPASIDGAIIQSALLDPTLDPPCILSSSVSATVGGVNAQVVYAGWVPDSIAGLYQVNLVLPSGTGTFTTMTGSVITNISGPVQLPIQVTAGTGHSQANVSLWVTAKP